MARTHALDNRFILAGGLSRDDLKIHLHAARLHALPSVTAAEAFSIAQVEAMAVGLPIVNTNLPTGVPDIARHGREALTVPPSDPVALAEAIKQLLNDRDLALRLGAGGRERAKSEYRLEIFVKRVEDVYENAMRDLRDFPLRAG